MQFIFELFLAGCPVCVVVGLAVVLATSVVATCDAVEASKRHRRIRRCFRLLRFKYFDGECEYGKLSPTIASLNVTRNFKKCIPFFNRLVFLARHTLR